jgi:hypothetical protein
MFAILALIKMCNYVQLVICTLLYDPLVELANCNEQYTEIILFNACTDFSYRFSYTYTGAHCFLVYTCEIELGSC